MSSITVINMEKMASDLAETAVKICGNCDKIVNTEGNIVIAEFYKMDISENNLCSCKHMTELIDLLKSKLKLIEDMEEQKKLQGGKEQ